MLWFASEFGMGFKHKQTLFGQVSGGLCFEVEYCINDIARRWSHRNMTLFLKLNYYVTWTWVTITTHNTILSKIAIHLQSIFFTREAGID